MVIFFGSLVICGAANYGQNNKLITKVRKYEKVKLLPMVIPFVLSCFRDDSF